MICTTPHLQELYVSDSEALNYLDCRTNRLTFSKMPVPRPSITTYLYQQQETPEIAGNPVQHSYYKGEVNTFSGVDLSSEYSVGSDITTFTWRVKNAETGSFENVLLSGENGLFEIPLNLPGNILTCSMQNDAFYGLNQFWSFKVINDGNITGINNDTDKKAVLISDKNIVRINLELSGSAELYSSNGQLVSKVKINGGETEINSNGLGLFLLKVALSDGSLESFKIMLK